MANNETPKEGLEYGIFTGEEIFQKVLPKECIIEGLLNKGDNLMITSLPGTGKSILALQLICNLTTGTSLLDTFVIPKPRRVLYVQTEGDRAETVNRLNHMKKALKIDNTLWAHYNVAGLTLNTPDGLREFLKHIKTVSLDYDVVIIDPLYPTVKGSLASDDVATDWQRATRVIRETYKRISYIAFHHDTIKENWQSGKVVSKSTENIFGSTMWSAWISANYKMSRNDGVYKLLAGKGEGRGRTGQGIREIRMRLIEPTPLYFIIDEEGLNESTTKVWALLRGSPKKKFRRMELEDLVDKSKPTICRALATLDKEGKLNKTEEEGLVYYQIKEEKS